MELLVRLIDKSAAEDASKRGDVLAICDDGHPWSDEERTNPDWVIIKVAGLLDTDKAAFLSKAPVFPAGRFRRREWFIDFAQLPGPARFDHPRPQEFVVIARPGFAVAAKQKAPMV